jgi:hypothetical protein
MKSFAILGRAEEGSRSPRWLAALFLSSLLLGALPAGAADAPKVLNVIAIKVKAGEQDAYLKKVKALNAVMKRLETGGTMRVWEATVAGDNTGTIYVGIEYPNLAAFGAGTSKSRQDEEWTRTIKELDKSGVREVVSNSLLTEITP